MFLKIKPLAFSVADLFTCFLFCSFLYLFHLVLPRNVKLFFVCFKSFVGCMFILKVYLQDFRLEISAIQQPRKVKLLLPWGQKELAGRPLECCYWSSESVLLGGDPGVNPQLKGGIIHTVLGEPWDYPEEAGK